MVPKMLAAAAAVALALCVIVAVTRRDPAPMAPVMHRNGQAMKAMTAQLSPQMTESQVWRAIGQPDSTDNLDGGFLTYYHTPDGLLRLTWTRDARLASWEDLGPEVYPPVENPQIPR